MLFTKILQGKQCLDIGTMYIKKMHPAPPPQKKKTKVNNLQSSATLLGWYDSNSVHSDT